jgi:xylan 1,4-beta-xylosidase
VTTHTYGVEGGFLDEDGQGDNKLSADPQSISADVWTVRRQMVDGGRATLPLYFTEWSTSYNPRDPVHDAYLSAPFILDRLKKSERAAQSMSYWTYTDLFEEAGPPPASFHGGFGLINREGIRKAAFFAYKYLNELGSLALENADPQSWLTRDGGNFAGLVWNYTAPEQAESDRPYFRKLHPSTPVAPVELTVSSLAPGTYRLLLYRTGYRANDVYSQYIEWGAPKDLTAEQVAKLQRLSDDAPEADETVRIGVDGTFSRTIPIRTNDVMLVRLIRMT